MSCEIAVQSLDDSIQRAARSIDACPLTPLILTDSQSAHAARQRRLTDVLAELGITPAEASLFNVVHYGITPPPDDLPGWAARQDYSLVGRVTVQECRAALNACLNKGWLQVVDEPSLARIAHDLRLGQVLGPIYGYPTVGGVDFTAAGADLWLRLSARRIRYPGETPFAYTDVVYQKTARYYRTLAAAVAAIEQAKNEEDVVSVSEPQATGPWRAQWWRRFADGYRIDIEERRQWQGCCSGSFEECYLDLSFETRDSFQLRDILDRHNVSPVEWLLLARMEDGFYRDSAVNLCRAAAGTGATQFGMAVSEEECRLGLDACLQYGWLRTLDKQVIDEVQAVLQSEPALLAIPRTAEIRPEGHTYDVEALRHGKRIPEPMSPESRWGEIDLSPVGATLYRTIAAAWLGPNWEDELHVSNTYCWEEHRYCPSREGFDLIAQEHAADGALVLASRVIPIGPWCVHWWERFPAGYRLELELISS